LRSICIPKRVEFIGEKALAWICLALISVEEGHSRFAVPGETLINCQESAGIRYSGVGHDIFVSKTTRILCACRFAGGNRTELRSG
jgi:hypothetical protein